MLSYVFWHWPRAGVAADEYETRQRPFHEALKRAPSEGFARSLTHAVRGAPWANGGAPAYEDWYLLRDSAALDPLNAAAVSASRQVPHDAAAALAGGGIAGLYTLQLGAMPDAPTHAAWFAKPDGVRYADFFARLEPIVAGASAALWMRHMTLAPAREFCLLSRDGVGLPPDLGPLEIRLRPVWG